MDYSISEILLFLGYSGVSVLIAYLLCSILIFSIAKKHLTNTEAVIISFGWPFILLLMLIGWLFHGFKNIKGS